MMEKNSFVFYLSFDEALRELPEKSRLRLYDAITDYALRGKETEFTGIEKAVFSLIKPQLHANNQRYENGCKGGEFGKLGGRPKKPQETPKETPKKPQRGYKEQHQENPNGDNAKNPNQTPNENENENDIPLLYPPQGGDGEDFQKKFFSLYCQFKKFSTGIYPQIDFEKLLKEFGKSSQLRKTFSWQIILDSYDGIVAGNFRDKVDETAAGRELMADRERWYTARREKAERKAEETYKRFMQDETFKGIERRLKELMPEMARLEVASDKGDFKAKQRLVKLTQEQGRLKQQRLAIIEMNGKTEDDLVAQYGCQKCNDTGYTEDGRLCDCYGGE